MVFLGHSFIFWAAHRASSRPGGRSLGFSNLDVIWRGIRGLRWAQVLPEVVAVSRSARGPVIIVLHVGGNDLSSMRVPELITLIRSDLDRIPGFFSKVIIVWSEIIPRAAWFTTQNGAVIEGARRTINARISRFIRSQGGVVIRHFQLEGDNSHLLRPDGIHLTDIGTDIFLAGLQDGIDAALNLLGGGSAHSLTVHLRGGIYWQI